MQVSLTAIHRADLVTLSRLIGVSCGTISRVLNNDPSQRVSAETRQRILDGAREYNYRPNLSARALSSRKTGNVALVMHDAPAMPESSPSTISPFLVAFERALHSRNYGLNLVSVERKNLEGSFQSLIDRHRSFDALLFTTMALTRPMLDVTAKYGIPTAAFRYPNALEWPTNYFHLDDQSDLYRSIELFAEQGCRDVAVIDWSPQGFYSDHVVSQASRQAMLKFGIQPRDEWFISAGTLRDPFYSQRDHGRDATRRLLSGKRNAYYDTNLGAQAKRDQIVFMADGWAYHLYDPTHVQYTSANCRLLFPHRKDVVNLLYKDGHVVGLKKTVVLPSMFYPDW